MPELVPMKRNTRAEIVHGLTQFHPHRWVRNQHLQTILGSYWLADVPRLVGKLHHVQCPDGDQLTLHEDKTTRKAPFKKIAFLAHGLGGSADSGYMTRMSACLGKRGWTVFRMNHRGCGKGAYLASKTYHSGKSDDISRVLQFIEQLHPDTPVISVGFSLSGNALLKMLGQGADPIPSTLKGAIAVTPPIELSLCAHELAKTSRWIYDQRFVRLLLQQIKQRKSVFPDFPTMQFPVKLNLLAFDELCTAPLHGYASAADYYTKCSAKQFLANINIPTLILASKDDPFIPSESFCNIPTNENLACYLTEQGGHMGFLAQSPTPLGDWRWMDYVIVKAAENLLSL